MKMLATIIFFITLTGCTSSKTASLKSEGEIIKTLTTYGCDVKAFDMVRVMGKLHVECK